MEGKPEDLVERYWQQSALGASAERADRLLAQTEQGQWALRAVEEVIDAGGPASVNLICRLADTAPGDAGLSRLGAGPLENLICGHGRHVIDELEEAARLNSRVRSALTGVWYGNPDPEVLARLGRFGLTGR